MNSTAKSLSPSRRIERQSNSEEHGCYHPLARETSGTSRERMPPLCERFFSRRWHSLNSWSALSDPPTPWIPIMSAMGLRKDYSGALIFVSVRLICTFAVDANVTTRPARMGMRLQDYDPRDAGDGLASRRNAPSAVPCEPHASNTPRSLSTIEGRQCGVLCVPESRLIHWRDLGVRLVCVLRESCHRQHPSTKLTQ